MAAFYKRNLNFVILAIISMEKGSNEFELLFKEYRRFRLLFQKKLEKKTLFKYQPWNHEILLIKEKQLKA
jgi:hypothetical protein